MTPMQCRMARAALELSTPALAKMAGLGVNTVNRFETGQDSRMSTVKAIRDTLESAGVIFVAENGDGPGVRLKKTAAGLDAQIAQVRERLTVEDTAPGPSPEQGVEKLRRGLAENQLRTLTQKKRRTKKAPDKR